jgi:L-threonylcarbamoyladenylate synthase
MQVESYVGMLTEREKTIIKKESDRPTTFIIENKKQIISDDPTLGIRIPKKGMITEVLKQYPHPIISTSVNISGEPSIEKIEDIPNSIKENVDFILNLHPQNSDGRPSRIIDLLETGIRVIRE